MKIKLMTLCLIFNHMNSNFVEFTYSGHNFKFFDSSEKSNAVNFIAREILNGDYTFDNISFKPGDVVIDIGAHVGMVSIVLAKINPNILIHAFEPIPTNYNALIENIKINKVENIIPHNKAVTNDGRNILMIINNNDNTGGATQCLANMTIANHDNHVVPSIPIQEIFKIFAINKCKLMKIDCEGSEHELFFEDSWLSNVEFMIGELHINTFLTNQGYSFQNIYKKLEKFGIKHKFVECYMADY
jgi:FkbM family methyltransferase